MLGLPETTANARPPDAWPDAMRWWWPPDLLRFLLKLRAKNLAPVQLPDGLSVRSPLPAYLLQEFHNLPNGNFSHGFTHGYSIGFELVMMGAMRRGREKLVDALRDANVVLDVGCGAGTTTAALAHAGKTAVGLDASPYMLTHARARNPGLTFVQGLLEDTGLPTASVSGVSACFVFHEMPPEAADAGLRELHRVLEPGGRLAILEPGPEQMSDPFWSLVKRFGWLGAYFSALANFVHEPFVKQWHQRDLRAFLEQGGFRLVDEQQVFPSHLLVAERVS